MRLGAGFALAGVLLFGLGAVAAHAVGEALATPGAPSACARGYSPCLPVVGDLDCGQIPDTKKPVRVTGADPYGLDRDRDGLGCEVFGEGGGRHSPWGLILRKGKKEATFARVGNTLTVVGWSPRSMAGKPYRYCAVRGSDLITCWEYPRRPLTGTVQTFGKWVVARRHVVDGTLKVVLFVKDKSRAFDTVPVR